MYICILLCFLLFVILSCHINMGCYTNCVSSIFHCCCFSPSSLPSRSLSLPSPSLPQLTPSNSESCLYRTVSGIEQDISELTASLLAEEKMMESVSGLLEVLSTSY